MAVQTSYAARISPAVAGMLVDLEMHRIVTRTVQAVSGTAGGLPFGVVVRRGTTDGSIQDASAATPVLGVTVLDPTVRPIPDGVDRYAQFTRAAVLLEGVIWVAVGASVTQQGSPAYFDATGSLTPTATANTLLANGVFDATSTIRGLVALRLT